MERQVKVYWVVIGWLVWTAILMATTILCTSPSAVQYVGFAATVTSLILGVVAIIYSFYSNEQSSKNVGSLAEASNKVIEGSNKISGISESIDDSVKVLTDITSRLNHNLEEIPVNIKGMRYDLDVLNQTVQSSKVIEEKTSLPREKFFDDFLIHSSFSGLLVLYAVTVSVNQKKEVELDLEALTRYLYTEENAAFYTFYFGGYLIASCAINIVQGKITRGGKFFKVKDVSPFLNKNIKDAITKALQKYPSYSERFSLVEKFLEGLPKD